MLTAAVAGARRARGEAPDDWRSSRGDDDDEQHWRRKQGQRARTLAALLLQSRSVRSLLHLALLSLHLACAVR